MEKREIIEVMEEALAAALNEETLARVVDKRLTESLAALPAGSLKAGMPETGHKVGFGQWLKDMVAICAGGHHPYLGSPDKLSPADLIPVSGGTVAKDLSEGTGSAGGYLVPTSQSKELISLVNNFSVMQKLSREVPMASHQVTFPTLTGGLTAYWVPEATDTEGLTPDGTHQEDGEKVRSDLTLGQMSLTTHTCAVKVVVSNQLLVDSDPSVDGILQGLFAETLGNALDVAILRGAGTSTDPITGLVNKITTNALSAGVGFDWDDVIDLVHAVYENSPNAPEVPVIGHSKAEKILMKLKDNDSRYIYEGPNRTKGMPTVWGEPFYRNGNILTNLGVGSDETRLFAGDFRYAYVGVRAGLVIRTNPWSNPEFSYNQTAFVAEFRVAFNVAHENRFAMLSGVPTS